ncbi:hypothetical protein NN561_005151 [Cricetulus griseus]
MQNCDLQIDSFRAYLLEFLELQVSGVHDPFLLPGPGPVPGGTPCGPGGRRPRSLFIEPEAPVPQPPPCHISLGGDRLDLQARAPRGSSWGSKLKCSRVPNALVTRVAHRERCLMALPGPPFFLENGGRRH